MTEEVREPKIVVRGNVTSEMVAYARDKLIAIAADSSVPVLDLELRLDHDADPARERPNHVEVSVNLNGTPVRAHRSAPTMSEATDRAVERLRRRVQASKERVQAQRLRHRDTGSWHHGDRAADRPRVNPRPVAERILVRRKTFALGGESLEEALDDIETLDHDFFLFVHDESNAEAVVYRVDDGYGLQQRRPTPEAIARLEIPLLLGPPPPSITIENALTFLDETDAPFHFFVDAASGHGMVAYRRYDGDYGLILSN